MSPTYAEVASSWTLWREYVDLDAVMTIEEFEAMSPADRVALQIETFGPEPEVAPTVEEVLAKNLLRPGAYTWGTHGGCLTLTEAELRPALEAAYDPTMPNWPSTVELE